MAHVAAKDLKQQEHLWHEAGIEWLWAIVSSRS